MSVVKCQPITIPNAGTVSPVVRAREVYGDADEITLLAPAALDAFTFSIDVTDDPDAAAPVYRTAQRKDTATDEAPPLATKADRYSVTSLGAGFRLKSSAAVAADRTWAMVKHVPDTTGAIALG